MRNGELVLTHQHQDAKFCISPEPDGSAGLTVTQPAIGLGVGAEDIVSLYFTRREWRTLSRHVEEALREAALLRRRAKGAERRKRDAMKGTR